jgi:hypothetical protein
MSRQTSSTSPPLSERQEWTFGEALEYALDALGRWTVGFKMNFVGGE